MKFISSPLGLMLLGTLLGSLLIPRWAAIWQDRQPELDLKSTLVQKIAERSTTTVRSAITLQLYPPPAGTAAKDYATLKQRWLVDRAVLQTEIGTYFPDPVARCWFYFSDRITDYVSLPQPNYSTKQATMDLDYFVNHPRQNCKSLRALPMYSWKRFTTLKDGIRFSAFKDFPPPKKNPTAAEKKAYDDAKKAHDAGYRHSYSNLGELLLLERNRVVATIVGTDAQGFSHGWWIFH